MNNPLEKALWESIRTFVFDDPASTFPFSKKLQKENSWSSSFTQNAIEEYRKFMFLCCILPNGASPSDTIDKVWHLHLTYTTNYWIDFCKITLQKDIHHHPSKGGNKEQIKYTGWYKQTLRQYKEVFGTLPPASILPEDSSAESKVSFKIYDPGFFKKTVTTFMVLTILFATALNIFKSNGKQFLVYYSVIMVAGIVVFFILQEHKFKKIKTFINDNFPANFSPFQIAGFLYGEHRAYQTALVDLLKRDLIDTSGRGYKLTAQLLNDQPGEENPLLPALREIIAAGQAFTYSTGFKLMDKQKLQQASFEQLATLSKKTDYQKFVVPGIVLAIGFGRLFQGMANNKPVEFLVLRLVLFL